MKKFKTIEPLSNFEIIELCNKLKIKNFKGVFMRDELNYLRGATKNECMIINTDHSSNKGTHWTCLFTKNGSSVYFDSYGINPSLEVEKYCKKPRIFNTFPIQKMNEVICGHYCIYVLYKLSNGYNFYSVLDELYRYSNE
jgi:hypothetical protein